MRANLSVEPRLHICQVLAGSSVVFIAWSELCNPDKVRPGDMKVRFANKVHLPFFYVVSGTHQKIRCEPTQVGRRVVRLWRACPPLVGKMRANPE